VRLTEAHRAAQDLLHQHEMRAPLGREGLDELLRRLEVRVRFMPAAFPLVAFRCDSYVVLQRGLPSEEQLWGLAHELGHVVMHLVDQFRAGDKVTGWRQEREADDFAGEILIGGAVFEMEPSDVFDRLHLPPVRIADWIRRRTGVEVFT
jgi:hypothetical protein